ncbi:MAG: DUF2336 domain-containing protein [Kordiimonadaceae bacterium]|nr:DUF2336 domain-containing protein [Kordiimonadaceae bacterium]
MIFNFFKKKEKDAKKLDTYEEARSALEGQKTSDKLILAEQSTTPKEVLYYLAEDPSVEIRKKIAGNNNSPLHADKILSKDENEEVKHELTRKIARFFPDISMDSTSIICEEAIEMIEILAKDQLPSVRQILSEELKSSSTIPKHIALMLAQDEVLSVCAPILEYSPLLSDADLKEIITATTLAGSLGAIAKREGISEDVCDAISTSLDIPAVTNLLTNQSAQIREETLDLIINEAQNNQIIEWHEPLAKRPNLSIRAMKRIATFVASSLVDTMISRNKLDPDQGEELLVRVRDRITKETPDSDDQRTIAAQAQDLFDRGVIDDEFIQNAIKNKQRELIIQSLILLSELPDDSVRKMLVKKKGTLTVSLAWKAGLSMRTALKMQSELAHVPPDEFLNAKNGIDYPMSVKQMEYDIALYE